MITGPVMGLKAKAIFGQVNLSKLKRLKAAPNKDFKADGQVGQVILGVCLVTGLQVDF